jgi:hypothetical protein
MRQLLVFGPKTFKITVPDEAKITFGPWSPPTGEGKYSPVSDKALNGTLRVYASAEAKSSILAVFSGVTGYRDLSIDYEEEVAREEGAIIWKSDKDGYKREEKVSRETDWVKPAIGPGRKAARSAKATE